MLDYFARRGHYRPSINDAAGSGNGGRRYSTTDVKVLAVALRLMHLGQRAAGGKGFQIPQAFELAVAAVTSPARPVTLTVCPAVTITVNVADILAVLPFGWCAP